jgi:hypothetical protein
MERVDYLRTWVFLRRICFIRVSHIYSDDADVVITTYATLAADYKCIKDDPNRGKPQMFSKRWLRIVLDEVIGVCWSA